MHSISFKLYAALVWTFLLSLPAAAQVRKSFAQIEELLVNTPVPVVFSVDPKSNSVTRVFIKQENTEQQLYELKEDCYRCEYYLGSATGTLKILDKKILNATNTVFTINTSQNLMKGKEFVAGGRFPPGATFMIGGIKTRVIENKQGVFAVKVI